MFASSQAEVQHGISIPLLLQLLDGKPLEEFLLALKITLKVETSSDLPKRRGRLRKKYVPSVCVI